MAPTLPGFVGAELSPTENTAVLGSAEGPLVEARRLLARTLARRDDQPDPTKGAVDPHDINNAGFFVLFAFIGVGFVLTGIWFFFWAKNGGIHFEENDWDEYKSTVLRRKGPNGTVLSGATESTNLGGGSVYKDVRDREEDDGRTVMTESTLMTGITAGASDPGARRERKKKQDERDRRRAARRQQRDNEKYESSRRVGADGAVEDNEAEAEAKRHLRSYRHERPARVGGMNKISEGSEWDGSTVPTESTVSSSLLTGRESAPSSSAPSSSALAKSGIRKVYSTADRNEAQERRRAEGRRLREEGKIARRDFSYQRSNVGTESGASESLLDSNSEVGTKSYHHPMPELRAQRQKEREERRAARRGGYRRGRTEDHDDDL